MNALHNHSEADFSHVAAMLDEAIDELGEEDRTAILLRFFEQQDFRAVGQALRSNEDAARMRVTRALVKLEDFLKRRGVTTSAASLGLALSANAVHAAPAGLATTISTAAAALARTGLATAATATKAIVMTTLQKNIIGATLAAAVGMGVYEAHQASRVRRENQNLISQQETLADERDKALGAATGKDSELQRLQKNENELLRLRGEIGMLRRQSEDLEKLREENRQLRAALAKSSQGAHQPTTDPDDTPERQGVIAKMNDAKLLVLGLFMHASDNQDRLPPDLSQATNYLAKSEHRLTGTNQFELVAQGSLKSFTNPAATIVVREKEASLYNGNWAKAYGFADGHAEIKREPSEGFDAWEKEHIPTPRTRP